MEAHEAFKAVRLYNELVQMKENALNAGDEYSASLIKSIIDGREIEELEIKLRDEALWKYSVNKYAPIYIKIKEAKEKRFTVKLITTEDYVRYYKDNGINPRSGDYFSSFDSVYDMLFENHGYGDVEEYYMDDVSKILIIAYNEEEEEDVLAEVIDVQG